MLIVPPFFLLPLGGISAAARQPTSSLPGQSNPSIDAIRRAAEQGDPQSRNQLGDMYYHGDGVPENLAQAFHWYRLAAEQDDAIGQYNLARMYREGKGITRDFTRAMDWYRKAARQDLAIAQFFLAKIHGEGQGVPRNTTRAYYWFNRAANLGDPNARTARDRLTENISPEQLAKMQRWTPSSNKTGTSSHSSAPRLFELRLSKTLGTPPAPETKPDLDQGALRARADQVQSPGLPDTENGTEKIR